MSEIGVLVSQMPALDVCFDGQLRDVKSSVRPAVEFAPLAFVADGWRQWISDDVGELSGSLPDVGDVAIGPGDVRALRAAVVRIGGDLGVIGCSAELTCCCGGVEDAGHSFAVVDLQQWIAEQVAGMALFGEHAADEFAVGGRDAVPVRVGGGAAEVFTVGEGLFVVAKALDAVESQSSNAYSSGKPDS
ncbi:hypothetical protein OG413_43250 [Streptomyces sp. NBC_01433]|uniref:hypothetical protein n=1 Tax=Streptomyces sp. NBC_01433 TaxID=2903864 RepID=UPI00225C3F82|nr:hypothetical protein [Streptomyces sp. NBC_01433]MCX4682006.1 hypothetical protein [Streptomyces sp. NBC_01433]